MKIKRCIDVSRSILRENHRSKVLPQTPTPSFNPLLEENYDE